MSHVFIKVPVIYTAETSMVKATS